MLVDAYDFDNPWRRIYEWPMSVSWFAASAVTLLLTHTTPVPYYAGIILSFACSIFGLIRGVSALRRSADMNRIYLSGRQFINFSRIEKIGRKAASKNSLWLTASFSSIPPTRTNQSVLIHCVTGTGKRRLPAGLLHLSLLKQVQVRSRRLAGRC